MNADVLIRGVRDPSFFYFSEYLVLKRAVQNITFLEAELPETLFLGGEPTKADRFLRHLEPLQGALEAFCRRQLRRRDDVEDALQSAVANAYRDFHLYAEGTNFRAWIFKYLNLEILGRNRRAGQSRERPLTAEPLVEGEAAGELPAAGGIEATIEILLEAPEAVLERCDDVLAAAVAELPALERSVLLLRAIGEFKYREIADILEMPVGSVMGYLGRSRRTLRRRLANEYREREAGRESP